MGIIRNVEKFIRATHRARGSIVPDDAPFEIIRVAPNASGMAPDLFSYDYNRYIEYRLGDYYGNARLNSVDLTTFWGQIQGKVYHRKMVIKSTIVNSVHDVLKDINEYTQLDLPIDTVLDDPIPDGTYNSIRVNLKDNHPWFTGGLDVPLHFTTVIKDSKPIVTLPISPKLHECAADPAAYNEESRYPGSLDTYGVNYTRTSDLLTVPTAKAFSIEAGIPTAAIGDLLARSLNADDKKPWVCTSAKVPFNLYGAFVIYNGPVGGYEDHINFEAANNHKEIHFGCLLNKLNKPRQDREYVMVILPNMTYNSMFRYEPIFIHYGGVAPEIITRPPVHYWPLRKNRKNYGTSAEKPEFLARGDITSRVYAGGVGFMFTMGRPTSISGKYHTPIGVDLPASTDFTLVFDSATNVIGGSLTSLVNIGCVDSNGAVPRQNYFSLSSRCLLRYLCELTPPTYSRFDSRAESVFWPHWATLAIVRRGDNLFIYTNGVLSALYTGVGADLKVINTLISYGSQSMHSFRDIRYFDYALSASQVKTVNLGTLDAPFEEAEAPFPLPKHYWELNGTTVDKGSEPVDLNQIFSYRPDDKSYDGKQVAYNTISGGSALGVQLKVDKDFTIAFNMCLNNPPAGYSGLGTILSGNGSHALSTYGTSVELTGSTGFEPSAISDSSVSTLINRNIRVQLVRKGNWLHYYLGGHYVRCQRWTDASTTYWDKFGGPSTLSNALGFRNLAYYDTALSAEHLIIDAKQGAL